MSIEQGYSVGKQFPRSKREDYNIVRRMEDLQNILTIVVADARSPSADDYQVGLANGMLLAWSCAMEPYGAEVDVLKCPNPSRDIINKLSERIMELEAEMDRIKQEGAADWKEREARSALIVENHFLKNRIRQFEQAFGMAADAAKKLERKHTADGIGLLKAAIKQGA